MFCDDKQTSRSKGPLPFGSTVDHAYIHILLYFYGFSLSMLRPISAGNNACSVVAFVS